MVSAGQPGLFWSDNPLIDTLPYFCRNDLRFKGTTSASLHHRKQGSVMGTTGGQERKTLGCCTEYVNVINHPKIIIWFVSGAWGLVLMWVFISKREIQTPVQTAVFIIQMFRIIIRHISGNTVWSCTGRSVGKKDVLWISPGSDLFDCKVMWGFSNTLSHVNTTDKCIQMCSIIMMYCTVQMLSEAWAHLNSCEGFILDLSGRHS